MLKTCRHILLACLLLPRIAAATTYVAPIEVGPPDLHALPGSLEEAIQANDVLLLARRLEAGADPNRADEHGVTPLMKAAERGQVELMRLLLDHGADPKATLPSGSSVMGLARGAAAIRLLRERGAEPQVDELDPSTWFNSPDFALPMPAAPRSAASPLHAAARQGDTAGLVALLDGGADVNATDAYGTTALHVAAEAGHEAALRLLLERGADAHASATGSGRTALCWATGAGHVACMQLLLDHGAGTDAMRSALRQAARRGHTEAIRLLVKAGAQVDGFREKRERDVVYVGWGEETPLHLAIRGGHDEAALALLALGADPEMFDEQGDTALLLAVRHKRYELVGFLSTLGYNQQSIAHHVQRATELARELGDEKMLRLLEGEQDWEE